MNKLEKMTIGLMIGEYPKTSQVLQGAMVSGFDRMSGDSFPGFTTFPYGAVKAWIGYYGHKTGEFKMSTWKKMSLYTLGAALPYADKIYCALAPMVENLIWRI